MGVCGSDLLSKFGPEIAKLVSIEKAKQFLDDHVKQNKQKIFSQMGNIKSDIFKNIDEEQEATKQKLKDAADDIDKKSKGALKKAASNQRKSVEQLMGGKEIDDQFKEIKEEVNKSFDKQERKVNEDVDGFVNDQKKRMDEQKPTIPIFNSLPASQQEKVMKEGEKKFSKQIKAEQEKVSNEVQDKLNPQKYADMFKKLNPTDQFSSIQSKLDGLIKNAESMSKATSLFC